jgi:hypothetical protein
VLRSVGGLLLAAGVVVVLVRKSGRHGWTDFEQLLVIGVPACLLFVLASTGERRGPPKPEPWRSVLVVASVLLSLVSLFVFLRWAGASTKHLLYDAGVLAVTGLIALAGARRVRTPYAVLLAAVALLGAWLLVWLKVLDHPSGSTVRSLILAGGALLLVASAAVARADALGARELAIVGGLGAVIAGVFGVFVGAFEVFAGLFTGGGVHVGSSGSASSLPGAPNGPAAVVESSSSSSIAHAPFGGLHLSGAQTTAWDVYLVIVAVGLIWLGAHSRTRGLGYVGAFGLLMFLVSAGAQLTRLESGHKASTGLVGWPLALVLVGLLALAIPLLRRQET